MKILHRSLVSVTLAFLTIIPCHAADWLEADWSIRAVALSTDDESEEFIEEANAINIALVSGDTYAVTLPSDDGLETVNFVLTEADGFYKGVRQGNFDGQSYEYEFLRAYRLDNDTGILMLLGIGGEGRDLQPVYYMDAAVAVIGRNGLPPVASFPRSTETYNGFASVIEVGSTVVPTNERVGPVSITPVRGGYRITPEDDGEPVVASLLRSGYLLYNDFSTSREGLVELLAAVPVSDTEICYVRFEGNAEIFDPFQNFNWANVEAGILSTNPDFPIPSSVGPPPPTYGPVTPVIDNWVFSSWLGYLYDPEFPWIYGPRGEWDLLLQGDPGGLIYFDVSRESFLWTSEAASPYVYEYATQQWTPTP